MHGSTSCKHSLFFLQTHLWVKDFLSMQARFYTFSFAIILITSKVFSFTHSSTHSSPLSECHSQTGRWHKHSRPEYQPWWCDRDGYIDIRVSEDISWTVNTTVPWPSCAFLYLLYMKIDAYIFYNIADQTIPCIFYIGMDTTMPCNEAVICPCYTSSSLCANWDRIQPHHNPDCRISGGWIDGQRVFV